MRAVDAVTDTPQLSRMDGEDEGVPFRCVEGHNQAVPVDRAPRVVERVELSAGGALSLPMGGVEPAELLAPALRRRGRGIDARRLSRAAEEADGSSVRELPAAVLASHRRS